MENTQIQSLNLIQKAFDAEAFRQNGHQLVDLLADYLNKAPKEQVGAVYPHFEPNQLYEKWQTELNNRSDSQDLLPFFQEILQTNIHTLHPNYMGHQVASPLPVNALADFLGSLLNSGMGVYEMGSPMVALERVVIQETAKAIGFSAEADGILTSGGSLGNLTALLCARSVNAGTDVWQEGNPDDASLALLVSDESHYCVNRAVKIMGWGEKGIVKVPSNSNYQMKVSELEKCYQEAQRAGKKIISVVANACSTSTGSYDPIDAIADFCAQYNLWLHVDGAHGGAVIFSDKYRHLVKGLERADSVLIDFHKMLSTTALATALIFKRGQDGYRTFAQKAAYLWENADEQEWHNLGKRTLECTKHAMSLRIYTLMRSYGKEIFAEHLDYLYDLGQEFYALLNTQGDFEVAHEPQCNIVCFRYLPENVSSDDLNEVNSAIRKAIIHSGEFYLVQTQLKGNIYLRTALMNPFTTLQHLKMLLEKIRATYQELFK